MKPNFALNLSLDGIDLFHRAKSGWQPVGTVSLDDPDIGAGLAMLRQTAVALESGGMTTKVIIPDSQILYTDITVDTSDPATRDANIRTALEGMTPYASKDLVFDWRVEDGKVRLAVLARETVAEAETFAREHRFNPVSFAAAPEAGRFPGEPFFGAAESASEMLRGLGAVEPDDAPIDLNAVRKAREQAATPPADDPAETALEPVVEAAPAVAEEAGPEAPVSDLPATATEAPEPAPEEKPAEDVTLAFTSRRELRGDRRGPGEVQRPAEDPAPTETGGAGPDRAGPEAPPPDRPLPRLVASSEEPASGAPPLAAAERGGSRDGLPVTSPRAVPDPDAPRGAPRAPSAVKPFVRPPEAPKHGPVVEFGNRRSQTAQAAVAASPDLRLAPEPELPPASVTPLVRPGTFGSIEIAPRRRSPVVVVVMTLVLLAALAALALWSTFWTGSSDPAPVVGAMPEPAPAAVAAAVPEARPLPRPEVDPPQAEVADETPPPEALAADPLPADISAPVLPDDPATAALAPVGDLPEPPADATGAALSDAPEPEASALPDAGEAATEIELAAPLADDPAEAAVSDADLEAAAEPLPAEDGAGMPGVDDEALADGEPEALLDPVPDTPALPQDPVTELVATDAGAAERVQKQLLGELTPEVAERRYAATGIWVLPLPPPAEPAQDNTEDIYVAAVDTRIEAEDAVALPKLSVDRAILSPLPPPAAGTTFDFDERGLVRATPEGAVNPDGILVFLGRPPVGPRLRPGGSDATGDSPAATPDTGANPLSGVRPRPRPGDLSETTEKAQLGGHTKAELAVRRPRQRPASVVTTAVAASAAGTEAVEAPIELAPATRFAVAESRMPKQRPAEIVAVAAAARIAPLPQTGAATPQDDGNVAEADGEPVVEVASAAVAPKIPTKASVAKNATVANAINLSKINLIGVYGSASERRALVRLSNGKYVKVKVGDRIDGGKVAAIGEAELVYVKGSRQVKLALPKT